eukprot:Plantae.Rhodophyta-Hildenbrandia_rubra.ctg4966.p1 GENE.Plantae.Rhodophyta-Hildenbrandia_rubra.ctg4966~~Plantae.Rhodophyta-Hildenbrandia_rubra.ctg4966.p1  ORF type:complete len:564 (+),score=46.05 Plantae.Rhodophyta-Hildenbrandia_rubra.ctg4966:252-1943(+)
MILGGMHWLACLRAKVLIKCTIKIWQNQGHTGELGCSVLSRNDGGIWLVYGRKNSLPGTLRFLLVIPCRRMKQQRLKKRERQWTYTWLLLGVFISLVITVDARRANERSLGETLSDFNISGQSVRKCPAAWNRYHYAWVRHAPPKLLSLEESRHRILLSTVRAGLGDGLGHVLYFFNYEVAKAAQLGLTFTFRHNTYQSVTKNDEYAVDNFFGWGEGELPREIIRNECILGHNTTTPDPGSERCYYCQSLAMPGNGKLGMKHLVNIPESLAFKCTGDGGWGPGCSEARDKLLRENNKSHTVFQLPVGRCSYQGTNSAIRETRGYFHSKYWNRHGRRGHVWPHKDALDRYFKVHYRETDLNIAVHVRRGDFFKEKKRKLIKDSVYQKVLADVLNMIEEESGPFSRVLPVVHIYSEGRKVARGGYLHDTSQMDSVYYDENGVPRVGNHWQRLLDTFANHLSDFQWPSNVKVKMHISGDTLTDLHNMIAADVFIGSVSAMSTGLVRALSRGVTLLPGNPDHDSLECCTTRYDADSGQIHLRTQFLKKWRTYEAANGDSLLRALANV